MKCTLLMLLASTLLHSDPIAEINIATSMTDDQMVAELDLNNPFSTHLPNIEADFKTPFPVDQPASADALLPAPAFDKPQKSPFLAANLSIIPGLGHAYIGDYKTAGALFGTAAASIAAYTLGHEDTAVAVAGLQSYSVAMSYGIYAAFRDARQYNERVAYTYQMPTDGFSDLAFAPVSWSVIKKPEVWGALLGSLAIATGIAYFTDMENSESKMSLSKAGRFAYPLTALPVGISEESLFRGYLQSYLSELINPPVGLAISSLAFGAAHIPNARYYDKKARRQYYTIVVPFLTATGAYLGWLTQKNHSLKESVALHTWYDFVLFALSSYAEGMVVDTPTEFAFTTSF